jgi:hypothetical protein
VSAGVALPSLSTVLELFPLTAFKGVEEEVVKRVSSVSREYSSRKKERTVMTAQALLSCDEQIELRPESTLFLESGVLNCVACQSRGG